MRVERARLVPRPLACEYLCGCGVETPPAAAAVCAHLLQPRIILVPYRHDCEIARTHTYICTAPNQVPAVMIAVSRA